MAGIYYPEMGETADESALFRGFHVINSTFSVQWRPERDAEARVAFKAVCVRPRLIEQANPAHRRDGIAMWSALVTSEAYSKLLRSRAISAEMLLD
jgi:hypothetical protein